MGGQDCGPPGFTQEGRGSGSDSGGDGGGGG